MSKELTQSQKDSIEADAIEESGQEEFSVNIRIATAHLERRLKFIRLPVNYLLAYFNWATMPEEERGKLIIPAGDQPPEHTKIVGVHYEFKKDQFYLTACHWSFERVAPECEIPVYNKSWQLFQ